MEYVRWLQDLSAYLPKLGVALLAVLSLFILIKLITRFYGLVHLIRQEVVYLEITPPAFTDRLPPATNQLFSALHGLGSSRSLMDRLLNRQSIYSLEIASTRNEGIRYLVRVSRNKAEAVKQAITAYLPEVKVRVAKDYLADKPAKIVEFRQKAHFAYPLQAHDELISHDPMAYLTNAMTKLNTGELMAYQLVLAPINVPQAELLSRRILDNEDIITNLSGNRSFIPLLLRTVNSFIFGLLDALSSLFHYSSRTDYHSSSREWEYKKQVAKRIRPVRTLSYFEHELVDSIHQKLAQPLFNANIRLLIQTESKDEAKSRRKSFASALSLFSVKYQALKTRRRPIGPLKRWQAYKFRLRLPGLMRSSNLLAVSEISGLYHFPHSVSAKTENVVKSLSKTLPAPVSLKNGSKLDILLGVNRHHGTETPIGLTEQERERHVYIIGGTGNGKTTMLLYGIVQDIKNGKSIAVLDPHGDLAETILHHIPPHRINDVIYMNPDDLSYPIGINLLELPEGLSGDELVREKDLVTEATISVMRKMFSEDDSGGHRIEYILRNAIQTALTLENPTLFTIFRLLNDTEYRNRVVNKLEDHDLKIFWKNELAKAGNFQRVKMAAGITAKIGRFLFSASAKRVLEQPKSTVNFENILNSGKILICNFSKGLLGEDTSTLFGTTVLAKLQMASLRRARIKQTDRKPFYLYVDEFQNFATMSFVQMLSEARKYKLFLTMAEQSTNQQDYQRLVEIILANVGTLLCFRSGSPADERLVLPLFSPYIEQGEIANLPAFSFYVRIAAVQAQEPLSGETVLLTDLGSEKIAKKVIELSRMNNAIEYESAAEAKLAKESKTPGQKTATRLTSSNKPLEA